MTLLANTRPLLRGAEALTITVSESAGALSVLITSRLSGFAPDTTDPALAVYQAALAKPVRILIPEGTLDPDAALADALRSLTDARTPVVDQMQGYLDDLKQTAAAAEAAKKAADDAAAAKKQAEAKGKKSATKAASTSTAAQPGSTAAAAALLTAPATEDDEGDAEDDAALDDAGAHAADETPASASASTNDPAADAAAQTLDLFS